MKKPLTASVLQRRAASSLLTAERRLKAALDHFDDRGIRMGTLKAYKDAHALYLRVQRLAFMQEKAQRADRELRSQLPPTFAAEEAH